MCPSGLQAYKNWRSWQAYLSEERARDWVEVRLVSQVVVDSLVDYVLSDVGNGLVAFTWPGWLQDGLVSDRRNVTLKDSSPSQ